MKRYLFYGIGILLAIPLSWFLLQVLLNWWVPQLTINENIEKYECTGTVGDTIGGLTAPVIGIFSAVLVFLAFLAQLAANNMQFSALNDEKIRYQADRWLGQQLDILNEIKLSVKELSLVIDPEPYFTQENGFVNRDPISYHGINALVELVKREEYYFVTGRFFNAEKYDGNGMFYSLLFILTNIKDLVERINSGNYNNADKVHVMERVKTFYDAILRSLVRKYIETLTGSRKDAISRLHEEISKIY